MDATGDTSGGREPQVLLKLLNDLQEAKGRIEQQAKALREANEQLKAVNQLKDEFVAKVSHELRTPLTSIKEGLSLILDGALGETTEEQRDFLRTMDGDIDRLTELVNNTLDIAKIEAGRMRLMRGRVDLNELIHAIIRSYQPIVGHRRIAAVWPGDVPPVFADPHRIRQVFANLFSNALRFTSDEGAITFRAERRNGMVAVAVEDDGPGIAPDDLPKLFQKFSQVGPPGVHHATGTGLGLTVSKELIELHGGTIDVVSAPDQGTAFTVRLPIYSAALALQEQLRELSKAGSMGGQAVGVVVIDTRPIPAEKLAEQVQAQLHRNDVVVPTEPSRIVVLALADQDGLHAMVERLRSALPGGEGFVFGAALSSGGDPDVEGLVQQAISAAGRALAGGTSAPHPSDGGD